jgi:biotin carboxyl carrier protein
MVVVESPMTGVFYRSPSPGAPAFAEEGDRVSAGQDLAIIEVMKLMNRLTSPVDGILRRVCQESESLVEHGQALFVIEPLDGAA